MPKSVVTSRRSFIKGAVAGAVSAGVAPVMAAPAPQNGPLSGTGKLML